MKLIFSEDIVEFVVKDILLTVTKTQIKMIRYL